MKDEDLEILILKAEGKAVETSDGHLSLLRFTTGWKVYPGTPELRSGDGDEAVSNLKSFKTLREALVDYLHED
jgi:hypothetical protein